MSDIDFEKTVSVDITLGHALLAWQTLSENFSDLNRFEKLDLQEKKSIWGLIDLLENSLNDNQVDGRPQDEWLTLIDDAKNHMKTITVDFVDE